jgi:hypothetical protein
MNPTPPTMTTPPVFLSLSNCAVTAAGAFSTGRIRIHRTATVAVARTNSQRFGIDGIKNCRVMANDHVPPSKRQLTENPRANPRAICPRCRKNVLVKIVKGRFEGALAVHRIGARGSSTCEGSLMKFE